MLIKSHYDGRGGRRVQTPELSLYLRERRETRQRTVKHKQTSKLNILDVNIVNVSLYIALFPIMLIFEL